jgi:AraC-like DNA-binding protein
VAGWVLLVGYFSLLHGAELAGISPTSDNFDVGIEASAQPPEAPLIPAPRADPADQPRSADDAVEDPRSDAVAGRLQELMQEQFLYREPTLSIARLARRSGYPEYLVSAVINRRFGCPFWDYVNRHRVDEARRCLRDPSDSRTALDIAYACGFTSKSTFNAAFKRFAGETPSACRAAAGQGSGTDADAGTTRSPPG